MTARPAAVLLASGRGSRYDATGAVNKLLERMPDGRTVLRASAENLLAELADVLVVVPPEHRALMDALAGLNLHMAVNDRRDDGMGSSIACGVAHRPAAAAWLIALADMPYVATATIRALVAALDEGASIVAPRFRGERGHPVGFGAAHLAHLTGLSGDTGARALLRNASIRFVDVADSGILSDIDTPGDLTR